MNDLERNLAEIRARIADCCGRYQRTEGSVRLVAVGKKHPADRIAALAGLGQTAFGENYLQEAAEKMDWLAAHAPDIAGKLEWHFIGHIQSRKCRDIAGLFDWVHTVDSEKVARRLDQHRQGAPLNVMLQVNIDDEETKAGCSAAQLPALARTVDSLPNLDLRGLMIIPRAENDFERQRAAFRRCRHLMESVNADGIAMDQLSMGMTADMEAAIAEGATMVRIGTALFGPRPGS